MPTPPPSSTPVIPGLIDVELHPGKSSINPSSLAGFHPGPLVVASPSYHLVPTAGCCISSWHSLVVSPTCHLVALAGCHIASCCPLVVLPTWLLIAPAGCCVASCCIALSSSHCTTLLASHRAIWWLSCLLLRCPLVILLFRLVVVLPLPLLLLLLPPPHCNGGGSAYDPHANAPSL
jgi:hypothetical protein